MASYNKIITVTQSYDFLEDEWFDLCGYLKPFKIYSEDLKVLCDLIEAQRLAYDAYDCYADGLCRLIQKCDDYGNRETTDDDICPVETGNDCRVTILHLGRYVQTLPSSVLRLDTLETLNLESANWNEFPTPICNFKNLKRLFLPTFKGMMELPAEFWDQSKLEVLRFGNQKISGSINKLVNLRVLIFLGNPADTFPEEIGFLPRLKELKICLCKKLSSLPNSVGDLATLKSLWMIGCDNIQSFPDSFGNLTSLEVLRFEYSSKINALPESLGLLTNLKELILPPNLKELPYSLWELKNLKYLNLAYTALEWNAPRILEHLRPLKSLQFLLLPDTDTHNEANWIALPELAAELSSLGYIQSFSARPHTQNYANMFARLHCQLGMKRARFRISGVEATKEYKDASGFPPVALWPSILSKADAAFAIWDPIQNLEPIVGLYPGFHRIVFPGRFGSPSLFTQRFDSPSLFSKSDPDVFFSAYKNAKYSRENAIYQLLQEYGPCIISSSLDKTTSSK